MNPLNSNGAYNQAVLTPDSFEKPSNPTPDQATFSGKQVEEVAAVKPKTTKRKITPEMKAESLAKRRIKNRISAQTSRDRAKEKLSSLENTVKYLSQCLEEKKQENNQLKNKLVEVETERNYLALLELEQSMSSEDDESEFVNVLS